MEYVKAQTISTLKMMKGEDAMKATVDRDTCISCGLCVSICPNVFIMDGENIAIVKVDTIDVMDEVDAREAAKQCPVSAIEIIED